MTKVCLARDEVRGYLSFSLLSSLAFPPSFLWHRERSGFLDRENLSRVGNPLETIGNSKEFRRNWRHAIATGGNWHVTNSEWNFPFPMTHYSTKLVILEGTMPAWFQATFNDSSNVSSLFKSEQFLPRNFGLNKRYYVVRWFDHFF